MINTVYIWDVHIYGILAGGAPPINKGGGGGVGGGASSPYPMYTYIYVPYQSLNYLINYIKFKKYLKIAKFWFPDLRIADFESSGPQLFKNQLFQTFQKSE